ncbi:MAG: alpha-glucuronidase [Spirochaetaceae bacterium]|jgi:alpha-glucuronidase|nr:alpha-glucuronidase [Spirochaetaceae bacterium]
MYEYDCWFQKYGENSPELPAEPSSRSADSLSRFFSTGEGEVFNNAVSEYRFLLKKCWNIDAEAAGEPSAAGVILEIIPPELPCNPPLPPEGFSIRTGADQQTVIAGADERGLLYGVYRFFALLAQGALKDGDEITGAPAAGLRMLNHWDNLDGSIERGYAGPSFFFRDNRIEYDRERVTAYARLAASTGLNRISINNVNVRQAAKLLITEEYLPALADLAALFRPFGIRLILAVNFASPVGLGALDTADPLDPAVADWWKERAALIYRYIPDLAGFIVKADSEGESGPFQYGRTHADGANMLAAALEPYGGEVVWRCFVYHCRQDWRDHSIDRARAAYDNFIPLDGQFAGNVILQAKYGPLDFQVLEPVMPLFGALKKTRYVMELQITQEYTGQQIDLCFLPWLWERIMNFDTGYGPGGRVRELAGNRMEGFAAVANVGRDLNWTGHTLAQANFFGFGRVAWNPAVTAAEIAREWSALSFGPGKTAETIAGILLASYSAYEKYNAPFGVCFMVTPAAHYGPNIEGYEFSSWGVYHRADRNAVGIDRTAAGTGYAGLYAPQNAAVFNDPASCPENLILFFHRLRYDYIMKNGETLLQNIYDAHFEGFDEVNAMIEAWTGLKGELAEGVYGSVLARFERQRDNAREWRDQINTYFYRKTGIADKRGRTIYE